MRCIALLSAIVAVTALPSSLENAHLKQRAPVPPCTSPVKLSGNPFTTRKLHANSRYGNEVRAAAARITDATLAAKAGVVADIGTFIWLDRIAKIDTLDMYLKEVPCDSILGLVIYDLPGRNCADRASGGELQVGAISRYKVEYIDQIVKILKANPNAAVVTVIEPDSLVNLVTSANLTICQLSKSGYEEGVAYALRSLNLPNVVQYIDSGHGGWLGWNDNLKPGALEIAKVYKTAGSPSNVRGIATNVAGWNAWEMNPGEFENRPGSQWNKAQDEKRFVKLFGDALKAAGFPSQAIIDTGRNGQQGIRQEWGHWCNVDGAGFGALPTANTSDPMADAFVWVKPGGESDGTSDTGSPRYNTFCGLSDAYKPSPEFGEWNQRYFVGLLEKGKPPIMVPGRPM